MKRQLTKTKKIWLSAVAMLVILNIWRWWPGGEDEVNKNKVTETKIAIEELSVAIPEDSQQHEKGIVRDIFHVQVAPKTIPKKQEKTEKQPKKSLPSAAQLAQQKAEAGLASIRLIATAKRKGRLEAYLAKGDLSLVVTEGMVFAQDYTVTKISADSIAVNHNGTGIQREIRLSE